MTGKIGVVTAGALYDIFEERIEELSKHQDEIVLICFTPYNEEAMLSDVPSNVKVVSLGDKRKKILFPLYSLLIIYHVLRLHYIEHSKFNVLHSLDYFVGPISVIIGGLMIRRPSIISVRGLPKEITRSYRLQMLSEKQIDLVIFSICLNIYYAVIAVLADEIITKSESEIEFLSSISPVSLERKIYCIPTGVNINEFVPNSVQGDNSSVTNYMFNDEVWDRIKDGPTVLYAGRITQGKGVLQLAKFHTMECLKDVELLIVGDSSDLSSGEYNKQLQDAVSENDNIFFYNNRVPHSDMPELIQKADIVAQLSDYNAEGSPKILQEALVMETPCIGSDIDGIKYTFEEFDGCELVSTTDVEEYKQAIQNLLKQSNPVDRSHAVDEFDLRANFEKVSEIYDIYI